MYFILALIKYDGAYSIHGLWPHNGNYCSNKKFDMDKIGSLLPRLHRHWYSNYGKDETFWKHEYEKHGTCSGLSEYDYFEKALDCFEKAMHAEKVSLRMRFD